MDPYGNLQVMIVRTLNPKPQTPKPETPKPLNLKPLNPKRQNSPTNPRRVP